MSPAPYIQRFLNPPLLLYLRPAEEGKQQYEELKKERVKSSDDKLRHFPSLRVEGIFRTYF